MPSSFVMLWKLVEEMDCRFIVAHEELCISLGSHAIIHCLWHCWSGVKKSIRPVKIEWWGVDVVICVEHGADCSHMVQLMPLPPRTPPFLPYLYPDWFYFSCTSLPRLSSKRGRWTAVVVVVYRHSGPGSSVTRSTINIHLSLIHIWRCRRRG